LLALLLLLSYCGASGGGGGGPQHGKSVANRCVALKGGESTCLIVLVVAEAPLLHVAAVQRRSKVRRHGFFFE
jgi:hypothetical protein